MSKLIAFAEAKDALGFKDALNESIAEKVAMVLDALREKVANDLFNEDMLDEGGPTRKHFKQVADVIAANPDAAKRKELAHHHAAIFASQNPRFHRGKFLQAANASE